MLVHGFRFHVRKPNLPGFPAEVLKLPLKGCPCRMKKREVQHTVRAPPKPRSAQSARAKLQHGASSKLLTVGRDIGLIRSCYRRARAFYAERRNDIHDHDTTLQKAVWSMVVV